MKKNTFHALYIAFAAFLGFDVRFNRKGEARFHLRDRREDRKMRKKLKRRMV